MKKEYFKVGQTAYVYLIGNAARGKQTGEERIEEWEVVSVGRKYIQARKKGCDYGIERFDSTDGFRQDRDGYPPEYELYTTKEELFKSLWRRRTKEEIRLKIQYESYLLDRLNDEELGIIYDILEKYFRREE